MMTDTERLIHLIQARGQVRRKEVVEEGIHPHLLSRLVSRGEIERVGRGIYRAPEAIRSPHEHLAEVWQRVPHGVICLLSALSFHGLGTQMPRAVWVALDRDQTRVRPRVRHAPVAFVWYSGPAFTEGQETHEVDGVPIRVYSTAKTTADLFKYRGKIGLDVAIEALRDGLSEQRFSIPEIEHYARVCRVWGVMRPYLQAMIA